MATAASDGGDGILTNPPGTEIDDTLDTTNMDIDAELAKLLDEVLESTADLAADAAES